jgi:hypothetical protein
MYWRRGSLPSGHGPVRAKDNPCALAQHDRLAWITQPGRATEEAALEVRHAATFKPSEHLGYPHKMHSSTAIGRFHRPAS